MSESHEDIQLAGANARAAGVDFLANPYLKKAAWPAKSGDTIEQWQAKHDAWHLGWLVEDAMR